MPAGVPGGVPVDGVRPCEFRRVPAGRQRALQEGPAGG
jgi:hypothetical protein